ncbi:MAG TPA: hypothetical protein VGP93_10530 [Polyangiaceae bacterium]|jgi:hypothetical protein|nr:hypothetical protein [Polyangiaceae bacterium]
MADRWQLAAAGFGCLLAMAALATKLTSVARVDAARGTIATETRPTPVRALGVDDSGRLLGAGRLAWSESQRGAIRGMTIGPIESALHAGKGYGSPAYERMLAESRKLGATWVSLTPFGRVLDLRPSGVDLTFEQPFAENRKAMVRAVRLAHAQGLKVMLVPHLWVENGEWRALIDPGDDAGWERWAAGYQAFVETWAAVARDTQADVFSVGVELRSWVTTTRAARFVELIRSVRRIYPGLITYAANWDDVEDTVILGELDLIGINAFFPLTDKEGASLEQLLEGGRDIARRVRELAELWDKPVLFTEYGYTTRRDPALRPWEWPDHMSNVVVDELAQADAYRALLAPLLDQPWFAGAFLWRTYSDPDDVSQEAEWGFSPRGKLAELVLRDAHAAWWAADGPRPLGAALTTQAAAQVGMY